MNSLIGEYIVIGACKKFPFEQQHLVSLLQNYQRVGGEFSTSSFLDIHPTKITFDRVWEGVREITSQDLDLVEDFTNYVLISLDIAFPNGIHSRILVQFLDQVSYEISIVFSLTQLLDEVTE